MNYYGTTTTSAGHYFYELEGSSMRSSKFRLGDLPFNPEALPFKVVKNGEVRHYQCFGLTILAICGSPSDQRGGSKSVFWVDGNFTAKEMKEKILAIPIGKKIIEQMPFEVLWIE